MAKNPTEGPVGSPQGKHDSKDKTGSCRCGRCANARLGWPKPKVVNIKLAP